jgi:Na+/H+-translocating membrane pyrophosphatase
MELEKSTKHRVERKYENWQHIIELLIVLATILGSTIPLYLHTDSKITAMQQATLNTIEAIRQDMKDFHGKLCALEEKVRK